MAALLDAGAVLMHPFVLGEIALGSLRRRTRVLDYLASIPQARTEHDREVMRLIESRELHSSGIGYVDAHLLCSVLLTPEGLLWTRDRRLQAVAERLGVDATTA